MKTVDGGGVIERGISYLVRGQSPGGAFTDFWMPVGASDAWVTAYVGLALHEASGCAGLSDHWRAPALRAAHRAAGWLRRQPRPMRGWGYNSDVPPDADSTAHAVSLLARTGSPVPPDALEFLREHEVPGTGFRTYRYRIPTHPWRKPGADITAAALRALHDAGDLCTGELAQAWVRMLADAQDERGWWFSHWWQAPCYPTGLVLEVWSMAGQPRLATPVDLSFPADSAFETAWAYQACSTVGRSAGHPLAERLTAMQEPDGGWPTADILRVPPAGESTYAANPTMIARDDRRLFTTATVVRAMCAARRGSSRPAPAHTLASPGGAGAPGSRSALGTRLDALVVRAARRVGFDPQDADRAGALFVALTGRSLAAPCPWPSGQLSSLAGGSPLEFSVSVGGRSGPSLRYTAEIGEPLAPPYRRAVRGMRDLSQVADVLGYENALKLVLKAAKTLVSPELAVPEGLRFWVWAGIDQGEGSAPVLKAYLNLLHGEAGPARGRLEKALADAGVPQSPVRTQMLDMLDGAGFPQEIGLGMGTDSAFACKIYYELPGWQRSLLRDLLALAELPRDEESVCPQIPGIMRESLAARSRSGVALRINPVSGEVVKITTAAPFPLPIIGHRETARRVAEWINAQGWDASCYSALSSLLLEGWEANEGAPGRLHSLFTRTQSRGGTSAAVYLRPCLPADPGVVRSLSQG